VNEELSIVQVWAKGKGKGNGLKGKGAACPAVIGSGEEKMEV